MTQNSLTPLRHSFSSSLRTSCSTFKHKTSRIRYSPYQVNPDFKNLEVFAQVLALCLLASPSSTHVPTSHFSLAALQAGGAGNQEGGGARGTSQPKHLSNPKYLEFYHLNRFFPPRSNKWQRCGQVVTKTAQTLHPHHLHLELEDLKSEHNYNHDHELCFSSEVEILRKEKLFHLLLRNCLSSFLLGPATFPRFTIHLDLNGKI